MSSPASPPYDLVVFDFDGTLADSLGFFVAAHDRLARSFGFRALAPGELEAFRSKSPRELMRHSGLPAWKLPLVARAFRRIMREDGRQVVRFPGIEDALVTLHGRGVRLALVSSNADDNCRGVLGHRAWSRFAAVECGASVFGKHRRLRRVARRLGTRPGRAIYIGDQSIDAQAARAAGMAFGAVRWGYAHPASLQQEDPDMMFAKPAELSRLLRGGAR